MNLIGIDLDGTLLTDKGTLSTYTKETIQAVCEKGHKVVIATGRHLRLTMPIVEELKLVEAVVCFNGATFKLRTNRFRVSIHIEPKTSEYWLIF